MKYIAEFPSIFSVYYNYISVFSDLFRSILNLHRHFNYVRKLCNEKFLDIRELDDNFCTVWNTLDWIYNYKVMLFYGSSNKSEIVIYFRKEACWVDYYDQTFMIPLEETLPSHTMNVIKIYF